nr:DUF2264 domain-containing protein [Myceligenerans indicum]
MTATPEPLPALAAAWRWTRDHWLAEADGLLAATEPYTSPGRALISLPGPASGSGPWSDGLEGFARTFLLAALRLRGQDGADPHGLLDRYADGLAHGTDPAGSERWPRIPERRQAVVEAASVAIGLAETRAWLWDRLDDGTRSRVVDWLGDIVGTSGYRNNWIWFQTIVESFLASVGGPWEQADLDRNEEIGEALYVGDGWYSDGRGRDGRRQSFDWYAGWAWHVYPLLHARIEGRPLADRHAARLREYLDQAQHLVGTTGAPLLQGRSITYRFALLAPFWAGALAGVTPLTPGATRTLTSAVADHFRRSGAVDPAGLLPIGWHGRYDRVRQLYTGPASPYWASKGFLGLLLPPDHDVWTAPPELPAPWSGATVTALPVPGWIVAATPRDGVVRVINHGSDRLVESFLEPHPDDPFYRRTGYSNITSPQLSAAAIAAPLDSHTALLDASGTPSHRDGIERVRGAGGVLVSRSRVHWLDLPYREHRARDAGAPDAGAHDDGRYDDGRYDGGRGAGVRGHAGDAATWSAVRRGPQLTTASVVRGRHEIRLARWRREPAAGVVPVPPDTAAHLLDRTAAWPEDPGPWSVHLGGWALAADRPEDLRVEQDAHGVRVVRGDGATSLVRGLLGADVTGVTRRANADPLGAVSVTPWVRGSAAAAPGEITAALVVLSGGEEPLEPAAVAAVVPVGGPGTATARITWPDGHTDTVELD